MTKLFFQFTILTILVSSCDIAHKATGPAYLDPLQPIDKRVDDLMSRMSLKEKVGQINWPCVYMDGFGEDIPAKKVEAETDRLYKEEYGDGSQGWHIERGAPPKPTGGRIILFNVKRYQSNSTNTYSVLIDSIKFPL